MPVMITHDTSVDYDVHGKSGPHLLLIGGLGFGRWGWFKQIPTLSRHFRAVSFDVRGEPDPAQSIADLSAEAVALLEHLKVRKAHVLGTSLGGFVAQRLALDRPDLVDRLVLVCTSYGGPGPELMSPDALGRMFGMGSLSPESAVRRGLETATSEAYREGYSEEFERIVHWRLADSPSLPAYYQRAMAGARFDASSEVGNIASPTLVIHGSDDRYVPVANAVALAEAIPDARLRILDGAGHLVFIERAREVNKEIVSFLEPRKRPQKPPAKPKRKQLVERARKAIPFLEKPRKPRKAKRGSALGKLKGWLRRPPRILGGRGSRRRG
ncbi:MAG: alpha/beta hydrolase [Actinomycetota bacterium]|nr:alpha/beta hydrolase [Actinomycetota bacterium]